MAFNPKEWGGRHTSKDYEFAMEGATPVARPISLVGHALTSPSQNLSDPVTRRYVKKIGGRIVDREEVVRPAEQLSMTFTILFGNTLETPALRRARRAGSTKTTFFAIRLCADPKTGHAYIFPDGLMNQPAPVGDMISVDDTVLVEWQTEIRVEEYLTLIEVFGYLQKGTGADPLYAVSFFTEDCSVNQDATLYNSMIAVGGQGPASPIVILISANRFATNSAPSSAPAPSGSIGTSVWTSGDVVLVGFSDTVDAIGTVGGVLFSVDAGDNFVLDADITEPIFGVIEFNDQYMACGGNTASGAYLAISDDGVNWTAVVDADLPAADRLVAISMDHEEGVAYTVDEGGLMYRIEPAGDTVNVVPITGFSGAPATLDSVDVKAADHIAIGGPTGYYAETFDGGATWSSPTVPSTDDIVGQAGNQYRSVVVGGTGVFVRDVLSENQYSALAFSAGAAVTGNVMAIAELPNQELGTDDLNYFVFVTNQTEVFLIKSDSPFA